MTTPDPLTDSIATHMRAVIELLGETPTREGLRATPHRSARALQFLTSGYRADLEKIVGKAVFSSPCKDLVLVRDLELYSLCEHHLLPFFGKAHVAYIPDGKIIGLSKIPRIVDVFARRLQVQENLTSQISHTLMEILKPKGVAVVIEAYHLCMMMRGVEKQNSKTITSSMLGEFHDDPATRREVLALMCGMSKSD